jgi:hypothetical protein
MLQLTAALASTWLMARLETRPLRAYGFSRKNAFVLYLEGAAIGIAGVSALIWLMTLVGAWQFDGMHLHGSNAWKYGLEWAVAFALTALSEETQMRGYLLAALSRGITFCPRPSVSPCSSRHFTWETVGKTTLASFLLRSPALRSVIWFGEPVPWPLSSACMPLGIGVNRFSMERRIAGSMFAATW